MSFTYGAVDAGNDPEGAADWQDRIDAWPAISSYKEQMRGLLPREGRVLDVGCGTGGDLVAIGVDRSVGVDPSATMCRRAAAGGAHVLRADGVALPFVDDAFAACRADRVLQHLRDPGAAVSELVRVVRPGGSIVLADPDQETLMIHVDGVPQAMIDRVKALRRDVGYRNGRSASRLPALLDQLGLRDVQVSGFPLVLADPADAFGIATWPRNWRTRGLAEFTDAEIAQWEHALSECRGFVYAVMYFMITGRRV